MELYINDTQVDINERLPFPLSYAVSDIRDLSVRKGSTSKTITLPGTQTNVKLMSGVFIVSAADSTSGNSTAFDDFDPTTKATARYYERGILQFEGVCQLRDCIKKNGRWTFDIVLFQESIDIFKLLSEIKIRELGWSEYNHILNKTNQENSWSGTIVKNGSAYSNVSTGDWTGEGYYYGIIDYGFNRPNADTYRVADLAPQIFVKNIVDKMFSAIGVTYDSALLDSNLFKRLLIAYEGGEFPAVDSALSTGNSVQTDWLTDGSGDIVNRTIQGTLNQDEDGWVFPDQTDNIHYVSDSGTNVDPSSLISSNNPLKVVVSSAGLYQLTLSGTLDVDLNFTATNGSGSYELYWQREAVIKVVVNNATVKQNVIYQASDQSFTLNNSKTFTFTYDVDLQLQASDVVELRVDFVNNHEFYDTATTAPSQVEVSSNLIISPNLDLDLTYTEVSITEGSLININQFLPEKMTCAEFFRGIMTMFNLMVRPTENNPRKLEIEPLDDFYLGTQDAFGNDITLDLTDLVDHSKEWRVTPTINFSDKEYKFTFQDDKDYWNNRYTDDVTKQYGAKTAVSSSEFATKVNDQKLPFSQKPLASIADDNLVIPRSYQIKMDNGGLSTIKPKKGKPFIVQLLNNTAGTLRSGSWVHKDSVGDTARTTYPYVGHIDDPDTPSFDLLYDVPDHLLYSLTGGQPYTTNNLYTYHARSIRELIDRNGKLLTCYVKLNANLVNTLDFRRLIKIDGIVYKLNKIENYESGKEDPTKIELIKLIEGSNPKTYSIDVGNVSDDEYQISELQIKTTNINEGVTVKSLGVDEDGYMVKTTEDVVEFSNKYNATDTEKYYISNDSITNDCTLFLMTAQRGKEVVAKNGQNTTLNINAEAGQTIDGVSSITLTQPNAAVQLYAINNEEWIIK